MTFRTGLSTMLLEGRADAFARLLYPDMHAPWTLALSPEEEAAFWKHVQPYLHRQYTDMTFYMDFMFGLKEGLPGWAGYKVGFQIVQAYLRRHPGSPVTEWTALNPAHILAESGYGGPG